MIWRRPTIRSIAKWALGAVLLAQVVVAAQACVMPVLQPAAAFSASAANPACEDERQPVDILCLAHCLQADQAVDSLHDSVAAPPATYLAAHPAPSPQLAALPSGLSGEGVALATGPPVYLRSLRLRI